MDADDLYFRPGTDDRKMFFYIQSHEEYHLPEALRPDDIIVDVGMHIGSFCYKALRQGSHRVHGFEADPANFACAERNLRAFGDRVRLHNKAVWRSDRGPERLRLTRPTGDVAANTGASNVVWSEGELEVETVALDDVLRDVTEGGRRRVRLLKIDCEGSEFPILLTSHLLYLVDELAGEFHEFHGQHDPYPIPERARVSGYERFTILELTAALQRAGFCVSWQRQDDTNMGMFHARQGRLDAAQPSPRPARRPWLLAGRRAQDPSPS